ncbi:hypothetical protein [Micromonospora chalcea]|uniref:hypothetical protein n=1 Tax=Micromonospora chalcea TaxID=1874 RepID=UPI003D70DD08
MSNSKELDALARRVTALADESVPKHLRWRVRDSKSGRLVLNPRGESTNIPFKDGPRTLINTLKKLQGMGMESDEQALAALKNATKATSAAQTQTQTPSPVPAAVFQPALNPTESTPVTTSDTSDAHIPTEPAVPNDQPVPYEQIEGDVLDIVNVRMSLRPGGGPPRNYKRIQGLKMRDGKMRYLCVDNKACTDTYRSVYAARVHLGAAHPSANTKAARTRRAEPAPSVPERAATTPTPMPPPRTGKPAVTPAAMPPRLAPELVRPDIPPRPEARVMPRPPAPPALASTAVPNTGTVDGWVAGMAEFITAYHHYRQAAEDGVAPLQQRAEAAERRTVEAERRAAEAERRAAEAERVADEERARADQAEKKLTAFKEASAALAALNAA